MLRRMAYIGTLLGVLAAPGSAFASADVTGVVQNIDLSSRQVVLDGERAYAVARGVNLTKFKLGDTITVHTEDQNGKDMVTRITKGDHFASAPLKAHSRIPRL